MSKEESIKDTIKESLEELNTEPKETKVKKPDLKMEDGAFEVIGIQNSGKDYYFYRALVKDGKLEDVIVKYGPEPRAVVIEKLRIEQSRMIMGMTQKIERG